MTGCANDPFLATLPIRLHGIASLDDRQSERDAFPGTSFAMAPSGAWGYSRSGRRTASLRRRAATPVRAGQRGLSHGELGSLRASYERQGAIERGERSPDEEEAAGPEAAELPSPPAPAAQLDVLAAAPPQLVPAQPRSAGSSPPPAADSAPAQPAASAPPLARLPRRLLELGWRRHGKQPGSGAGAPAEAPRPTGLAYLLVTGEDVADDQAADQRSRAAMLRVDAKIAALSHAAYLVRVLQGDEEKLRGDMRPAGQLSRRDIRQVAYTDFAAVLEEIRALLRRDLVHAAGSGAALVRPVVVFFVPDPPLANPVAVDVFSRLAQEARSSGSCRSEARALLVPAFGELPHVSVRPDDEDVADEIADLLTPATCAIAADAPSPP